MERRYHNGDELFHNDHFYQDFSVSDFWHFAFGDLLDNTYRGHLAEFIVSKALDLDTSTPREDWSEYDLSYNGYRIEIKSSSFIQSWNLDNERYSRVSFSVSPSRKFDSIAGGYPGDKKRHSDFYIFCLYSERDKTNYDILDLSKWQFFILPTVSLNEHCKQNTVSFSTLERLKAVKCSYSDIKFTLDKLIEDNAK